MEDWYADVVGELAALDEKKADELELQISNTILHENLFGVDLSQEAVEITALSLWIRTAERGKTLADLSHNIQWGNSVVSDLAVHPKAFDWQAAFPEVFSSGGFDVVIGNPPYVRQELLSKIKPYLQQHYATFHGMADLYVYFYERGIGLLRAGGWLSFIVTNKWMKAGYGEPLRKFFTDNAWVQSVVDFGHAKQIFEDADVFPSIIVARKPTASLKPATARLCTIPREQLRIDDLSRQIEQEGVELPLHQLSLDGWQLEPGGVTKLIAKIRAAGEQLSKFAKVKPRSGILTGLNEVFLIDTAKRKELLDADPACGELIRPYLRGQDIDRWLTNETGLSMIVIESSANHRWPWSDVGEDATAVFKSTYPSIFAWMAPYEDALRKRQHKGLHWWELRACAFWDEFYKPKIVYQVIQFHPSYALDRIGVIGNDKTFFIPTDDLFLLAVLNSPLFWWYNWRTFPHMKDEALCPLAVMMSSLPIAAPTDRIRETTQQTATRLIEIYEANKSTRAIVLDWLRVEYSIEKVSLKLQSIGDFDSDALVAEVRKIRGKKNPLTAAALKNLRDEYTRTIEPARALAAEALVLERRLNELVNEAYGLTPEEISLMWKTAPPRMPLAGP